MPDTNSSDLMDNREYQQETKASRFALQSGHVGVLWSLSSLLIVPVLLVTAVVTTVTGASWLYIVAIAAGLIGTVILQGNLLLRFAGVPLVRWLPLGILRVVITAILIFVVEFGFFFLLAFDDSGNVHAGMKAAAREGLASAAAYAVWPMLFGLVLGLIFGAAFGMGEALTLSGYVRRAPWSLATLGGWLIGCMFGSAGLALAYVYDTAGMVPQQTLPICLTLPLVVPLVLSSILTSFELSFSVGGAERPGAPVMHN